MVDAELLEQRGLQVAHMHRVFHDVVRELVGLAVDRAALDAAAGEPEAEAARMVIAAIILGRELALRVDGAPELPPQMTVSSAALFQIYTSA